MSHSVPDIEKLASNLVKIVTKHIHLIKVCVINIIVLKFKYFFLYFILRAWVLTRPKAAALQIAPSQPTSEPVANLR